MIIMPTARHPMRDINRALDSRNRFAERVRNLEGQLREAHQQLESSERRCWAALPQGYSIVLGARWTLSTRGTAVYQEPLATD